MPFDTDFQEPLGTTGQQALLRAALQGRTPYCLFEDEDPEDFVPVDAVTGATVPAILWHNALFWFDPDDTTTAHDGMSTLVCDGKRYKIVGHVTNLLSVLDSSLAAPPGSEALGDTYLVAAAATGDWTGHSDDIAHYTARGWEFQAPVVGQVLYVEDDDAYVHYSAAGTWVAGFGDSVLSTNSVLPANILGGRAAWTVENQTTDTPPGSPTDGVQYVIGPSPTGDWAGHATKLAIAKNNAWIIVTPVEGWRAYDKALNKAYTYDGAAWVLTPSGMTLISTTLLSGAVSAVDFTGLDSTYETYLLVFEEVGVTTNGANLLLRVGTGAGPTYQATAYEWILAGGAGISADLRSGLADTAIRIGDSVGSAANEAFSGEIYFGSPDAATVHFFRGVVAYVDDAGTPQTRAYVLAGRRTTAGAITAVRILPSTGSVDVGRISLYGLAKQ